MNKQLLDFFNEVEHKHWWWEGRRQILRQALKSAPNLKILDIGCGTGETMTFLRSHIPGCVLYGVDVSADAIEYAKNRGHKNIELAGAEKLPFPDNYFDYVLLLDVIEHIEDDVSVLVEARRVLKPNGKVIITTPSLQFIWSEHDTAQGHFRRYSKSQIHKIAEGSKLKVDKIGHFNFFLSPPIIFVRLLSKFKPFQKLGKYDSKLNFNIVHNTLINNILKFIFVNEIKLMELLIYPFGISIFAALQKLEV